MRIVCTSDLHENLPVIPKCDLLIIAGDLTYGFPGDKEAQYEFLDREYRIYEEKVPAEEIVVIAGNHDECLQYMPFPEGLRSIYLQDSGVEINGKYIWGTPWQPWYYDWAFNAPYLHGELFLAEKFAEIPDKTDIVVCHGPPYGYGDAIAAWGGRPTQNVGSTALLEALQRVKPELMVCGHIHVGYGEYTTDFGTHVVNAALVDQNYKPANPVVVLDL